MICIKLYKSFQSLNFYDLFCLTNWYISKIFHRFSLSYIFLHLTQWLSCMFPGPHHNTPRQATLCPSHPAVGLAAAFLEVHPKINLFFLSMGGENNHPDIATIPPVNCCCRTTYNLGDSLRTTTEEPSEGHPRAAGDWCAIFYVMLNMSSDVLWYCVKYDMKHVICGN